MNLRKGIAIAVAVTIVLTIAVPLLLLQHKPLRQLYLDTHMDMDNIRFYGRVIDQHGQPVAGAEVPYSIGGSAIGGYRGEGKKMTDANGEFSIATEGSSISLGRISHPDIEFGYPIPEKTWSTWGYSHRSSLDLYGFQPQAGDNQALWTDTSPDKPYVFKAWRSSSEDYMKAKNVKAGEYLNIFQYDKVYSINMLKSISEDTLEGETDGLLKVIFHKESDKNNVTQKWSATIIPINGGIQTTHDTYMNMAPASGYQPEIHIVRERKSIDENINSLANQQYYFMANNGKFYGSLFVKFESNVQNGFLFKARYRINPDGERILVKSPAEPH